jgi:hypothetical protein
MNPLSQFLRFQQLPNPAREYPRAAAAFRAHDVLIFTVAANQPRIGRAVQREVRFIERGGQMAQAGIDGNDARAPAST